MQLLAVLVLGLWPACALIAHDCSKVTNGELVLVKDSEFCEAGRHSDLHEEKWSGTVLQLPLEVTIPRQSCSFKTLTTSMYCTYFNNPTQIQLIDDDMLWRPTLVPEGVCRKAWSEGIFNYGGFSVSVKVGMRNKMLMGTDLDEAGFCKTSKSTSKVVRGVLLLEWVEVEEYPELGKPGAQWVKGEGALVDNPSRNSSTSVGLTTVLDSRVGQSGCSWSSLYQGEAKLVSGSAGKQILVVNSLASGFVVSEPFTACGVKGLRTSDSSVFLIPSTHLDLPSATENFHGRLSSLFRASVLGMGTLLEQMVDNSTQEVLMNQCRLERKLQENMLDSRGLTPELLAYRLLGKRGWTILRAGAAVLLSKCSDVLVKLNPQETCFADVPVSPNAGEHLVYADPLTWSLSNFSHPISCNDPTLPIFQVRESFYRMAPQLMPISGIKSLTSNLLHHTAMSLVEGEGIYSDEMLTRLEVQEHRWSDHAAQEGAMRRLVGSSLLEVQLEPALAHRIGEAIVTSPKGAAVLWSILFLLILNLLMSSFVLHVTRRAGMWGRIMPGTQVVHYGSVTPDE